MNDDKHKNLFDCGIDEDELEGNLRFLQFMKGVELEKKEDGK